jgi:hypothetical protein
MKVQVIARQKLSSPWPNAPMTALVQPLGDGIILWVRADGLR